MALGHSGQVWPVAVCKLESGFFARDREMAAAMQAHQFSTRLVPDIDEPTQFFRVRVNLAEPGISGEVWVVLAAPGYPGALAKPAQLPAVHPQVAELRPRLLATLPEARFCFVTDDREGFACLAEAEATPVAFAAAVSVVKYYAAWDESDPIVIATDREQFLVSVHFTADHYLATVRVAD